MTMHTMAGLAAETQRLRALARALVTEDAVQEAFVVGAAKAPADRPLGPWLARVARNFSRMSARAAHRREAREREVGLRAAPPATPADLVERVELHQLLASLVLALPVVARDILLLRYFEELSFVAIARRLAIPEATARWRHAEALRALRAQLDDRQPNRAWLPALAAFAGRRPPLISATAAGLIAAAVVTIAVLAWLSTQLLPAAAGSVRSAQATRPTSAPSAAVARTHAELAAAPPTPTMVRGDQVRINGVVVDEHGNGVGGAALAYLCLGMTPTVERARSEPGGAFSFLIERDCRLSLTARIDERVGHGMWAEEHAPDAQVAMTVKLVRLQYFVVHVVDAETRAPIAGAEVRVLRGLVPAEEDAARTDASGAARVPYAEPVYVLRKYFELRAAAPEHAPIKQLLREFFTEQDRPRDVTIAMPRGYLARGLVLDPDGAPVADATIAIDPDAERAEGTDLSGPRTDSHASVRTQADGSFEVRFARAGRFQLTPRSPALVYWGAPPRVTVGPGLDARITLRLERRADVGLVGVVLGPDGAPFAGARIITPFSGVAAVITAADGTFAISEWRYRYSLFARAGNLASETIELEPSAKQHRITLRLGPSGLAGTAIERDGTPVAGAELWVPLPRPGRHITTDAAGHFEIDVPGGTYRLSIRRTPEDDYLDDDDVLVTAGSHDLRIVVP